MPSSPVARPVHGDGLTVPVESLHTKPLHAGGFGKRRLTVRAPGPARRGCRVGDVVATDGLARVFEAFASRRTVADPPTMMSSRTDAPLVEQMHAPARAISEVVRERGLQRRGRRVPDVDGTEVAHVEYDGVAGTPSSSIVPRAESGISQPLNGTSLAPRATWRSQRRAAQFVAHVQRPGGPGLSWIELTSALRAELDGATISV
jgi:hypothetical protein